MFRKEKSRHGCPMKPHTLEDVEHMRAYPSAVTLARTLSESPSRWVLFTDGAGPVPGKALFAGWGVAVWDESSLSPSPHVELYGPVCTTVADSRWIGADSATNNTGELTAMVEALLWLESEATGPAEVPATIFYDSTYAYNALTSSPQPAANDVLVTKARAIFDRVRQVRPIDFKYFRGHSGNQGNDHADRLAGLGANGLQTTQSCRWLIPMASPPPVNPLQIDHCWKCGRVFSGESFARQLAGHEAYCQGDIMVGRPDSYNAGQVVVSSSHGSHRRDRASGLTMLGKLGTCTKKSAEAPRS